MVRRYEDLRAVLFHASNQLRGLATSGVSIRWKEGNGQGMKEDRKHEVRIRKCASRIYRVCVSGLYKIDNNFSYKNVKFNNYTVVRD